MTKPIVSSQWLFDNLNNPDIVILDASQNAITSNKTVDNNTQIPGARFFNLKDKFSDKSSSFPNTIPSKKQFEQECQKLGVNQNSMIVVFDNQGIYSSPRVWWMFKVMGHEKVAVLNGGLPEWVNKNYNTLERDERNYRRGNFKANFYKTFVKPLNTMLTYTTITTNSNKE